MKRSFMCGYGNCIVAGEKVTISIPGDPGDRKRFCCLTHAVLWLRAEAATKERERFLSEYVP